jgi:hypothetical protein
LIWRATTWGSSGPRLGEVSTPIPASRSWGSATGELGAKALEAAESSPGSSWGRSPAVNSGQSRYSADNHNRRSTATSAVMGRRSAYGMQEVKDRWDDAWPELIAIGGRIRA